jgi:D-alanyl-D-alanine carboxypeptidase/D-alanyl-D-alanine-endopeptidase (penicillin-binding protein 4)
MRGAFVRSAACMAFCVLVSAPASLLSTASAQDAAGDTPVDTPAPSRTPLRLDSLDGIIDRAMSQREVAGARVAVLFESRSGTVLYERNADRPLIPASNMKIVTGACALATLGPNHRFVTEIATDGPREGRILRGNLYVRGAGDPSLVSEELWRLVEEVRVLGIDEITGDIVLDASLFDSVASASSEAEDGDRAYHARTGALSLNFNSIAVHVNPGDHNGAAALVSLSPETGSVELRNKARTGPSRRGSALDVRRSWEDGRNVVTVTGNVPEGSRGRVVYRNLDDPTGCFGAAMAKFLDRAGVAVGGKVREGLVPGDAEVLVRHESKPLSLIVRDLGKYSSNFVAEQLLKAMAAGRGNSPGSTDGGAAVLKEYLESIGADSGSYRIADGSGFSRENRLTVRTLTRTIRAATAEFEIAYEFIASLSVSGTDGTLEDRMGFPGLRSSVRAKTGLLDGVTAISGILKTVAGDEVLFSIITNGFECEAWRLHDVEHEILTHVARTLPRGATP